jgi:hypothetical protein
VCVWGGGGGPFCQGNLDRRNFGLDPATFAALARRTHTLIHAAAFVNWLASYADLRQSNVVGTAEVIRLALAARHIRGLLYILFIIIHFVYYFFGRAFNARIRQSNVAYPRFVSPPPLHLFLPSPPPSRRNSFEKVVVSDVSISRF